MGLPRDDIDVILKAIRGHMSDVHVAKPGKVVRYDNARNLADVEVQVKQAVWDDDNGRTYEITGTLPEVSVIWPRFNGFIIAGSLAVGDEVLLVFNDTAVGEWRNSGQLSEPWDSRRHSIGYPVAVPGYFHDSSAPGDDSARAAGIVIGKMGGAAQIRITSSSIEAGASGTAALALGDSLNDVISNILACTPSGTETGLTAIKAALALLYPVKPLQTTLFKAK